MMSQGSKKHQRHKGRGECSTRTRGHRVKSTHALSASQLHPGLGKAGGRQSRAVPLRPVCRAGWPSAVSFERKYSCVSLSGVYSAGCTQAL